LLLYLNYFKVLEILLDVCNTVISKHKEDLECWLQGLERLAKATVLGHLLPVILTAMTHPNLRCLQFGDNLMSQLVHLVVLTSQVNSSAICCFCEYHTWFCIICIMYNTHPSCGPLNKRKRKPKGQSKMDNPEKQVILSTRHR
jgi:hypothetical protein